MRSVKLLHRLLSFGLSLFASKDGLAVSVKSQRCDLDVGWVNGQLGLLSVDLLLDELFDVDAPSAAVAGLDLSGTALVSSAHDLDCVAFADGDGPHVVFRF